MFNFIPGDIVADDKLCCSWVVESVSPDKTSMKLRLNVMSGSNQSAPTLSVKESECKWGFVKIQQENAVAPQLRPKKVFNVGFAVMNGDSEDPIHDETQLDVEDTGDFAGMMTELMTLFNAVCRESGFNAVQIEYVEEETRREITAGVGDRRKDPPIASMMLPNGYRIVVGRTFGDYDFEMYLDIMSPEGMYEKPLAVVRPVYKSKAYDTEIDRDSYRDWGDTDLVISKDRFEVLFGSGCEDYNVVETLVATNGVYDWKPYIPFRENSDCGMAPALDCRQNQMCYIPLNDGYGLCAVKNPADNEIYVGIMHGLFWWQNLCRFRYAALPEPQIHCECFMEWTRGYDNRTESILLQTE